MGCLCEILIELHTIIIIDKCKNRAVFVSICGDGFWPTLRLSGQYIAAFFICIRIIPDSSRSWQWALYT